MNSNANDNKGNWPTLNRPRPRWAAQGLDNADLALGHPSFGWSNPDCPSFGQLDLGSSQLSALGVHVFFFFFF